MVEEHSHGSEQEEPRSEHSGSQTLSQDASSKAEPQHERDGADKQTESPAEEKVKKHGGHRAQADEKAEKYSSESGEKIDENREKHAVQTVEKSADTRDTAAKKPRKKLSEHILGFFEVHYKKLLIIPFILLFVSLFLVVGKIVTEGTFVDKDVSLKGGVTVTLETDADAFALESFLSSHYPSNDLSIRTLKGQSGVALAISADIDGTQEAVVDTFLEAIEEGVDRKISSEEYSIEIIGSSLGASFFKETLTALLIAFLLMSLIVFIYFRSLVPSAAVILAAFSDIVVTLAIVNLLGIKLGSGGIAAFLMLIGYSVDTDMLLTTRMMKRKDGSVFERAVGAFKTGMMMNLTTLAGVIAALFFVESETIRQILTIIVIGLLVDIIFTWIQNVGILRWHLEKKSGGRA